MTEEKNDKPESVHQNRSPDLRDLLTTIDSDFKERYWRIWIRHYLLDATFFILVFAVLIIISIALYILLIAIEPLTIETNLPFLLTSLAIVISLISLIVRIFTSPPSQSSGAYTDDICRINCELISQRRKIDNDLLLLALVRMKAIRPKISLVDVYSFSPLPFEKDELAKRFYY